MSPLSLWPSWPSLADRVAAASTLLLFLDYDGTLVPLADHPSHARLSAGTKRLLQRLAKCPGVWVMLVSGRALGELRRLVSLRGLCYVGNHGLELRDPQIRYVNPAAQAARPVLRRLAQELTQALRTVRGAWVENKELTLSVHYRDVAPDETVRVKNVFYAVLQPYQAKRQVRVTTGHCVFEVRPPVRWTKATMVSWLLTRRLATANGSRVLPVYIGDDLTDEDAFEALRGQGVTVAVGPSTPLTQARYYVETPQEVRRLLQRVLEVRTGRKRASHA